MMTPAARPHHPERIYPTMIRNMSALATVKHAFFKDLAVAAAALAMLLIFSEWAALVVL